MATHTYVLTGNGFVVQEASLTDEEIKTSLEVIETVLQSPEIPPEVHNTRKVDPALAMKAVRDMCS